MELDVDIKKKKVHQSFNLAEVNQQKFAIQITKPKDQFLGCLFLTKIMQNYIGK